MRLNYLNLFIIIIITLLGNFFPSTMCVELESGGCHITGTLSSKKNSQVPSLSFSEWFYANFIFIFSGK
jgi:hypothetical protein